MCDDTATLGKEQHNVRLLYIKSGSGVDKLFYGIFENVWLRSNMVMVTCLNRL